MCDVECGKSGVCMRMRGKERRLVEVWSGVTKGCALVHIHKKREPPKTAPDHVHDATGAIVDDITRDTHIATTTHYTLHHS